jgi:hypothetical protein
MTKHPHNGWLNWEKVVFGINAVCVQGNHSDCHYGKVNNCLPCECPCHKKIEDLK